MPPNHVASGRGKGGDRGGVEVGAVTRRALCVIVASLAIASSAKAMTGVDLHRFCETSEKYDARQATCDSYVAGVVDGMLMRRMLDEEGRTFCPPEGGDYAQMILVVRKYIREHPEHLDQHAGVIVAAALALAFPCDLSN